MMRRHVRLYHLALPGTRRKNRRGAVRGGTMRLPAALRLPRWKGAMRFVPNIRYGTERYPEKVARRLRATNIAAWIAGGATAFFAVWRLFQGVPHWKYAALVALAYGLTPLLHRFSPVAAPLALAIIADAWIFWLGTNVSISNGITLFYFTAGALGILLLGAERVFLCIVIGAVATGLLIVLHLGVRPGDINFSGFPSRPLTFVFNVL